MNDKERRQVRDKLGFLPSQCKVVIKFPDGEEHHYPLEEDYDVYAWDQLETMRPDLWELGRIYSPRSEVIVKYENFLGGWLEGFSQSDRYLARCFEDDDFHITLVKRKI